MPGAPLHILESPSSKGNLISRKWLLSFLVVVFIPFFFTLKTTPSYVSLPNSFEAFVGREEILAQIKKNLFRRSQKLPVVALWGEGGIGKSETAIQFSNQNLHKFSLVYWVNAGSEEIYQQSYYNLAQQFNIPHYAKLPFEKVRDKVHEVLENHKFHKPWLLIYDNADQTLPLPQRGRGKILITTRDKTAWEQAQCLEITPLSSKAADELYGKILGTKIDPEWQVLAQELNYFPLALYHALHYIKDSPHFSMHDYLIIAKKSKKALFKQSLSHSRYPHNLLAVWQMSASDMKAQYPQAYTWLQMCAYFHPDKIPINWVEKWLSLQGVGADEVKKEANDLLRLLVNQGHIRLNHSTHSFSLHRLKQELIKQEAEQGCEKGLDFLVHLGTEYTYHETLEWTDVSYEDLANWVLNSIWWLSENKNVALKQKVILLNGIANIYTIHSGEYEKVMALFNEGLALVDTKEKERIYLLLNKGYTHLMISHFEEAQKNYEEALELAQQLNLKQPSLEVLRCYLSFIMLENYRSCQSEALKWCEKAEQIEEVLFKDHWNAERCEILKWKGEVLRCLGQTEEAFKYTLQALKINKSLFENQPNLQKLHLLISLGRICALIEEYDISLKCRKSAHELAQFWPGSLISSITLNDLATIYQMVKELKQALNVSRQALKIYNSNDICLTPPYYYCCLANLGGVYLKMKQPKKALAIFSQIQKSGFLETTPLISREKYWMWKELGNSYCALGQDEKGIFCLEKALSVQSSLYSDTHFALRQIYEDLYLVYQHKNLKKAALYKAKAEEARALLPKISEERRNEIYTLLRS